MGLKNVKWIIEAFLGRNWLGCTQILITIQLNHLEAGHFFSGFSNRNSFVWASNERILSTFCASINYKTKSNKVDFLFSNDAEIINSSWISALTNMQRPWAKWSESRVLIGYPSRPDELILPVLLKFIRSLYALGSVAREWRYIH